MDKKEVRDLLDFLHNQLGKNQTPFPVPGENKKQRYKNLMHTLLISIKAREEGLGWDEIKEQNFQKPQD